MPNEDHDVIDWDDLSESDRYRAVSLLKELNEIFDKYSKAGEGPDDEKILPKQS